MYNSSTLPAFLLDNMIFIILFFIILAFSALAYIVLKLVNYSDSRAFNDLDEAHDEIKQATTKLQYLEELIVHEEKRLLRLTQQELEPQLEAALDMYEQSNIRVPRDIIEDAAALHFPSIKHALQFIETQRQAWRQENMKKVYKGDL